MGNINVKGAFRTLLQMIDANKINEQELIRAIAAFSSEKDNGKYEHCGFAYMLKTIETWITIARGKNNVYLICDRCNKRTICSEVELKDNAYCHCGGRRHRDDQSGAKAIAQHKPPMRNDMPTLRQLTDAADRAQERGNDAMARIILAQIESGHFRHDRHDYQTVDD